MISRITRALPTLPPFRRRATAATVGEPLDPPDSKNPSSRIRNSSSTQRVSTSTQRVSSSRSPLKRLSLLSSLIMDTLASILDDLKRRGIEPPKPHPRAEYTQYGRLFETHDVTLAYRMGEYQAYSKMTYFPSGGVKQTIFAYASATRMRIRFDHPMDLDPLLHLIAMTLVKNHRFVLSFMGSPGGGFVLHRLTE